MRRFVVALTALVTAAAGMTGVASTAGAAAVSGAFGSATAGSSAAQSPSPKPLTRATQVTHRTLPKRIVRAAGPASATVRSQQQLRPRLTTPLAKTAQINVIYTGFPTAARTAFQAAVDIWATKIHSSVPITIAADWSDLDAQYGVTGILGAAGPSDFVTGFSGAAAGVFYPIAIANAMTGTDLLPANQCLVGGSGNPSGAEIVASFNSAQPDWYYGTDGSTPAGKYDLETVVLHELGHGLGFVGTYDGLNPSTGADEGKGYFGLGLDGNNPTIFDTNVTDGSGNALGSGTYPQASTALGGVLRGGSGGPQWNGTNGKAANGTVRPKLYAPGAWEEGSSFSHLDEATFPNGNANSLMTPFQYSGESQHDPGAVVLGMFQDMGWPTSATLPNSTMGQYHPVPTSPLPRVAHQTGVTSATPVTVQITGKFGVPASAAAVTSVAVNVEMKNPTATTGYWSVLPGCNGGPGKPAAQAFTARQTRTSLSVTPVDSQGRIRVWLSGGTADVNVDLVGWYGASGVYYHHLQNQQVAALTPVTTLPSDVLVAGKAGIPSTGATAVVLKTRVSASTTAGWLFAGTGGVVSTIPTLAYAKGEMRSALAIVPLPQSGAAAGRVRLRLSAGAATVSLEAVGWYGASATGGQQFHPAGPSRYAQPLSGSDVTVNGFPGDSQVALVVHLSKPSATGWLGSAPGGQLTLHGVQEYRAGQPIAGPIVTTTNTAGQLRLHLSAGVSVMYVDYLGWFAAT